MNGILLNMRLTAILMAAGIMLITCKRAPNLNRDEITRADYTFMADQLKNFNLSEELVKTSTIVYKNVGHNPSGMQQGFYLYMLELPEGRKDEIVKILEDSKTLMKGNLSDDILFALKAGDQQSFNINFLRPRREPMQVYKVSNLTGDEQIINIQDLYFHYQRFRVYEDTSKVNMMERRKKFIMFEVEKNRILYYNSFYKYR